MLKPGDILIIHNTPFPLATRIISRVSDGSTAHHCATVSTDNNGIAVYDAWPPVARMMSVSAYLSEMNEWSASWKQRFAMGPFSCDVWRGPAINSYRLVAMRIELERHLDKKYRMVVNYLFATERTDDKSIHCSEMCARALFAAGVIHWEELLGIGLFSQVKPSDVVEALKKTAGWEVVDVIE